MGVTSFARWFRGQLRALGSNPLIRASDRLEALAVLAVLATALFAVPIAARAGAQIYDAGVHAADQQAHDRHSVEAVAVDGSTSMPSDFHSSVDVRVQWRDGTQLRTERVVTADTVVVGQPLQIWLASTGKVVAAPLTSADATLSAIGAAGTVWVALVTGSALAALVIHRRLDRLRESAWERELLRLAHNDDGWANRHP